MNHLASLRGSLGASALALSLLLSGGCEDAGVTSNCDAGSTDPACLGLSSGGNNTGGTNSGDTDSGTNGPGNTGDSGTSYSPVAKDLPCDVAPILETYCQDCHGVTPKFGAPMPLLESSDFHSVSQTGSSMTQRTLEKLDDTQVPMPPPQSPQPTDDEMATLKQWLQDGAPAADEGCGADVPVPGNDGGVDGGDTDGSVPDEKISFEGAPDDCTDFHVLRAHGAEGEDDTTPYHVPEEPLDSGNQYMCFYFSIPYDAGSQGLWFDPIIDDDRVLHHWLLYGTNNAHAPGGTKGPCSAAEPGAYLLAGWAPGADSFRYPSDVGLQMPSGGNSGLILEVHYYNTQKLTDAKDRSGVKFCTAPANTREHTAGVHFLGSEGICVYPGEPEDVQGPCYPRKDMGDIHILNVWPHMHQLGTRMKAVINRGNGSQEVLHNEPFDFNNQINYPKDDIIIRPEDGDNIQTTCTFHNTRDYPVGFGDKTQDEMCYLFVTAWPVDSLSTDPWNPLYGSIANPVAGIGSFIQPTQRCLNPVALLDSCGSITDYPTSF